MKNHIEQFILSADAKALATYGKEGINVVPVSSLKIVEGNIWLINYFMDKTLRNIIENNQVALVCWKDMMGYQIKGTVYYETGGERFCKAVEWIHEILPDRIVKGLIILKPESIYDIAPAKNTQEAFLDSLKPSV